MSYRSVVLFLIFTWTLACSTAKMTVPVAEIPDAVWAKYHYVDANDIVAGAKRDRLQEAALSRSHKEVRIWIGGGHGWPQSMYRFVISGEDAHGERFWYWPTDSLTISGVVEDYTYQRMESQCGDVGYGRRYGVCRQVFPVEPDWNSIYADLVELGVWTLEDESVLRPKVDFLVLDGWAITVELRDGARYRSYDHNNPKTKPWPQARKAAEIAELLWERL